MSTRHSLGWITVFGLGHMRPAPGTWGSLPPVFVAAALLVLGLGQATHPVLYSGILGGVLFAFSLACIVQGDRAEAVFGKKDPSEAVADETAGQALALIWLPRVAGDSPMAAAFTLGLSFFAFRLFDIVKPWPARGLQRIPGGWGILIDDLFAGLYALCLVHLCAWVGTR